MKCAELVGKEKAEGEEDRYVHTRPGQLSGTWWARTITTTTERTRSGGRALQGGGGVGRLPNHHPMWPREGKEEEGGERCGVVTNAAHTRERTPFSLDMLALFDDEQRRPALRPATLVGFGEASSPFSPPHSAALALRRHLVALDSDAPL